MVGANIPCLCLRSSSSPGLGVDASLAGDTLGWSSCRAQGQTNWDKLHNPEDWNLLSWTIYKYFEIGEKILGASELSCAVWKFLKWKSCHSEYIWDGCALKCPSLASKFCTWSCHLVWGILVIKWPGLWPKLSFTYCYIDQLIYARWNLMDSTNIQSL